ncbi:MAG: PKD domain-containing protein [Candidatus Neomarinimicrobiota bacterium]
MNKIISITIILTLAISLKYFNDKKRQMINSKTSKNIDSNLLINQQQERIEKNRIKLEEMAQFERTKLKVTVEHDSSPITNSYPIILDASGSYDPDMGDVIKFKWKQISGPKIKIMPDVFRDKVSFEGTPGEYTFELIVSDNYGAENKVIKTVIIEPEPNLSPVIKMKIRQGSELN